MEFSPSYSIKIHSIFHDIWNWAHLGLFYLPLISHPRLKGCMLHFHVCPYYTPEQTLWLCGPHLSVLIFALPHFDRTLGWWDYKRVRCWLQFSFFLAKPLQNSSSFWPLSWNWVIRSLPTFWFISINTKSSFSLALSAFLFFLLLFSSSRKQRNPSETSPMLRYKIPTIKLMRLGVWASNNPADACSSYK